jgi:GrpB-like predicted nucleotidyltransferase (UPF0157 family)
MTTPDAADAPIELVGYDASWPALFAAERDALRRAIGPWLRGEIEHIGSTAVPGMAAKPVIDMMAPVESLQASRPALERLAALGYCYAPYREDVMHWLCKPSPRHRTHHLHLVVAGSPLWEDRIAFRDALRADPAVARRYAELKERLAREHRDDREVYTDSKGPFIEFVLRSLRATGASAQAAR